MLKHGCGHKINEDGGVYPTTLCQVRDIITDEVYRFGNANLAYGSEEEAVAYVESRKGWENRLLIVRVECLKFVETKE